MRDSQNLCSLYSEWTWRVKRNAISKRYAEVLLGWQQLSVFVPSPTFARAGSKLPNQEGFALTPCLRRWDLALAVKGERDAVAIVARLDERVAV